MNNLFRYYNQRTYALIHILLAIIIALTFALPALGSPSATSGSLRVTPVTAYNFVVDSNVETPASYGPSSAYLSADFCNDSTTETLSEVYANIGNYVDGTSDTPGIYPARTHMTLAGTFSLTHEGGSVGTADATRYIGDLAPGECKTQYWLVSYPTLDDNGDSVTGPSIQPDDDLWLEYDIWATADEGGVPRTAVETRTVTMRNEISAMANKIWPNGDNKVPQEYLDAISGTLGWDTLTSGGDAAAVGDILQLQGVWYDMGTIGQGFDNNGDLLPDYNAWMQPIGDVSFFDPSCFRLVHSYGLIIVKLNDGTEYLIPFEDQLYFENLPENNTGAVGLIFYEFLVLDGPCTASLTPYQEVASGYDNEKFNADFGTGMSQAEGSSPTVEMSKVADPAILAALGDPINYTIAFTNTGTADAGQPAYGMPVVIHDSVPAGTEYVADSAAASNTLPAGVTGVNIRYSTDGGATWSSTEPSPANTVTDIQWWLDNPLPAGESGGVTFQVTVPAGYPDPVVPNTGELGFGEQEPFLTDDATTFVPGANTIAGTIFEDDGDGSNLNNGTYDQADAEEVGIPGITVTLYISTADGLILWGTEIADANGDYAFDQLPDGDYVIETSVDLPAANEGWTNSTPTTAEVLGLSGGTTSSDNDFGFVPALTVNKTYSGPDPAHEGDLVTFSLRVNNEVIGEGGGSAAPTDLYAGYPNGGTDNDVLMRYPLDGSSPNWILTPELDPPTNNGGIDQFEISDDGMMYFTDGTGNIVELDYGAGSTIPTLIKSGVGTITDLDVDFDGGYVYYVDWMASGVFRIATDGTGDVLLFPKQNGGADDMRIAIDVAGGYIYWVENDFGVSSTIYRGNLDGSGTPTALVNLGAVNAFDIELDPANGALYVSSNVGGGAVERFDMSTGAYLGTPSTVGATAIALDLVDSWLYYAANGSVYRTPLYATESPELVIAGNVTDLELPPGIGSAGASADTTLDPVPLVDTYDPARMEFVSASVAPDSASPGTLTWDNVGPITAGDTETVLVTFRLLEPTNNASETITNTATVDNAFFATGLPANDGSDDASLTIDPRGSLSGTIWAEGDGGSSGWTDPTVGYEAGADQFVPGATVTLYACMDTSVTPNVIKDPTTANLTKACGAGGTNTAWVALDTTTTDDNGFYEFVGLEDGFYYAAVDTASLPGTVTQTGEATDTQDGGGATCGTCDSAWGDPAGDLSLLTPISAASDLENGNFGYDIPPAIFGNVWQDNDGDGIADVGENGLVTVTVTLHDCGANGSCGDGDDGPDLTTTTDANGDYWFEDLVAGQTYEIEVNTGTLPGTDPWTETAESDGSVDNTIQVTPGGGELSGSHDFGFTQTGTASIGDMLYHDWNGDGTQDPSDEGIPNVTIDLYEDSNGDGVIDPATDAWITSTVTGPDGSYNFANLPAGDYIVVVDESDPDMPIAIQTGDPDKLGEPCTTCDGQSGVSLTSGQTVDTVDFGYQPLGTGSIGDTVFVDANGDGSQAGLQETGIVSVTVELWADLNGDGTYIMITNTTTAADGSYLFENLPDGDYQVVVDTGDADLPVDSFGNTLVASTPVTYTAAINGGDVTNLNGAACTDCSLDADFGFATLGSIGDMIFYDANANGTQDWNEEGIPGVVVTLTPPAGVDLGNGPGVAITTTTSDGSDGNPVGSYQFVGLPPGDYDVAVDTSSLPGGLTGADQTADPDRDGMACDDTTYPTMPACDNQETGISVTFGSNYVGADFGYQPLGVIGDFVFFDQNGDGIQDWTEPGIAGLVVTVTNGIETYTTTTDYDGQYTFSGLGSGDWTVTVEEPANMAATSSGDVNDLLNGVGSVGSASTVVTIDGTGSVSAIGGNACSDCALNTDFGFQLDGPYTMTGSICLEDTGTTTSVGGCETGDVSIAGQAVYLYNDAGDYLGSTTTDASGVYTFTNLVDDVYLVATGTTMPPLDNTVATTTVANDAANAAGVNEDQDPVTGVTETAASVYQTVAVGATTAGADNAVVEVDFAFESSVDYDFGDLPEIYNTTLEGSPSGPRHILSGSSSLFLGALPPDSEINGAPSSDALGDGVDEDGITADISTWTEGAAGGSIDVQVTGDGYLVGWFDFNGDGDFLDVGEMVVSSAVLTGTYNIDFDIPAGTLDGSIANLYARFRLFESPPMLPQFASTGLATNGEVEDYLFPLVAPPIAVNDQSLANPPGPVGLSASGNDSDPDGDLDPATVDFDPASVPGGIGSDTDGDGDIDQVVVPGEGSWSVDDSGNVSFIPEVGFTADPTPIDYTISDSTGLVSNVATIIIDYVPVAVDDSSFGNPVGATVIITDTVLNDSLGDVADPTTVSMIVPISATNVITDASGDVIGFDVPGEGSWSVDPVSGNITFTPEVGFTLDPTPIDYTVEDDDGNLSNPATVTIDYVPVAVDDSSLDNPVGATVTITDTVLNDSLGDVADPTTVSMIVPISATNVITDASGDVIGFDVPGEGSWSVDPVSGNITFTPEVGFTGDPAPIDYTVEDDEGNVSNPATVTVTYLQNPPVAVNDSSLANPPGPVGLSASGNDSDPDGDLDPATVDFDPASVPGGIGSDTDGDGDIDEVVVPGEGVWSVDDSGNVSFIPEVGFTGDPTPIDYTISDSTGLVSNVATITIDYVPVAVDDSSLDNPVGATVTITDTVLNDSLGDVADPTTVSMIVPISATNVITDASGDVIGFDVPGEGSWSVDPVSGNITFTPEVGFTLDPTPIDYTVEDDDGNLSNPATVTIDYVPVAVDDSSLDNPVGATVTITDTVLNDSLGDVADPTTVSMIVPISATNVITDASGDVIGFDVPGEGSWSVDPVSGNITFTPEVGFTGDPAPIDYTVEDDEGNVSNPATVTVTYLQNPPVAVNDSSLANPPGPVGLSASGNDSDPDGDLDPATVDFDPASVPGGIGSDTDGDGDIDEVVVPGEGVWSVDDSGNVSFIPEVGFTGDPTPIDYTISDSTGLVSNVATITIDYVPVAVDDSSLDNPVGATVTITDTVLNDSLGDVADPTTVSMIVPISATNVITDASGDVIGFDVPGEGSWSVDPVSGNITFIPEVGFTGDPTPIDYTVEDDEGNVSNPATVTVTYLQNPPVAVNDSSLANPPGPVGLSASGNDSDPDGDLDPATVDFDPASVPGGIGSDTDGDGDIDEVVVPGEGIWSVDDSGNVTFIPEVGFTGDPTPIDYTISDSTGLVSNVATIIIDYVPVAVDDSSFGNPVGATVTITDTVLNDSLGDVADPTTVSMIVPISATNVITDASGDVIGFDVPGEGSWSVDPVSGNITFTPEVGFTGDPTPIDYTVEDDEGNVSNPATVTVTYLQNPPVAVNDSSLANPPGPVGLSASGNDSDPDGDLDPATVDFDPASVPGGIGSDTDGDGDIDEVVVPGEGIWSVDDSGNVTFIPEVGFTADPTPIDYTISDSTGLVSNVATITIDYVPVAVDDSSTDNPIGSPVTVSVVGNDSLGDSIDPTTVSMIPPVGATNVITDASGDVIGFDVPGEGSWSVDPVSGDIIFIPEAGFSDDPTPIDYTVDDDEGNVSNPATVLIDYLAATAVALQTLSTSSSVATWLWLMVMLVLIGIGGAIMFRPKSDH